MITKLVRDLPRGHSHSCLHSYIVVPAVSGYTPFLLYLLLQIYKLSCNTYFSFKSDLYPLIRAAQKGSPLSSLFIHIKEPV